MKELYRFIVTSYSSIENGVQSRPSWWTKSNTVATVFLLKDQIHAKGSV